MVNGYLFDTNLKHTSWCTFIPNQLFDKIIHMKEPFKMHLHEIISRKHCFRDRILSLCITLFSKKEISLCLLTSFLIDFHNIVEKTYQIHDSQWQYGNNHPAGSSVVPVYNPDLYIHGSLTPSIQHVHQNMSTSFLINFL